ncbi:unnamed protein product [marine sediment metagenome]|uniref:Uncharacterized protein n=10 Tax=marine sediment metagenome TaxID=412755 RepID=X1NM65_9ZZZZ
MIATARDDWEKYPTDTATVVWARVSLETGKLEFQSNGRVDVDGLEKVGVGRINKFADRTHQDERRSRRFEQCCNINGLKPAPRAVMLPGG